MGVKISTLRPIRARAGPSRRDDDARRDSVDAQRAKNRSVVQRRSRTRGAKLSRVEEEFSGVCLMRRLEDAHGRRPSRGSLYSTLFTSVNIYVWIFFFAKILLVTKMFGQR